MPYKFSRFGDFRTYADEDCIILRIEIGGITGTSYYTVLIWSESLQEYIETVRQDRQIKFWYVYLETTEKQKRQQKLFQQLGNAHRAKKLLDEIFSNSVDVLNAEERSKIWVAEYQISKNYIPMLQTQMRNIK